MRKREIVECPKCHRKAVKESTNNPIRNVTRFYLKCKYCDCEKVWEEPS